MTRSPLPDARPLDARPLDAPEVEAVAHLSLQLGRLLLLNGAGTEEAQQAVVRFARAFGCEAQLLISYEALLLTLVAGEHFRTKIGQRLQAMNVGLAALTALGSLVDDAEAGRFDLAAAGAGLAAIEHRPPEYERWLVVVMLGLTAASLSRLFGGDWAAFAVSWLAGSASTWLRQQMGTRHANPAAISFCAACLGGVVGGIGVTLGLSATPSLCLVAPGMILVPGVPLINAVLDAIRNHMTLALARLGFAAMMILAIAFGLFVATLLTGAAIPVHEPTLPIAIWQDAAFSALAALGYVFLFNVPARVAWACVVCGVASHTTRTLGVHLGIDLIAGTLVGALVVGFLAQGFGRLFHAPAAAFAFPGVVAMVPGAYAFRAILGSLQIAHGAASPALIADTLTLGIAAVLMTAAIAIGIAVPAVLLHARYVRG